MIATPPYEEIECTALELENALAHFSFALSCKREIPENCIDKLTSNVQLDVYYIVTASLLLDNGEIIAAIDENGCGYDFTALDKKRTGVDRHRVDMFMDACGAEVVKRGIIKKRARTRRLKRCYR